VNEPAGSCLFHKTQKIQLKRLIGQLGNETNSDGITFSLGKINCSVEKNSLSIVAMSLFCPKGQFLAENVYKCGESFSRFKRA
jgi:hypothetical protein